MTTNTNKNSAPEAKPENPAPEVKASNLPSTDINSAWGAIEDFDQNDFLVSKIFHIQGLSKFASDGLAKPGDWCDSVSGEALCPRDKELEIILFKSFKNILVRKWVDSEKRFVWIRTDPFNADTANFSFEEQTAEGLLRRQMQYNFFCLTPNFPNALPYVLSLSSTKVKTAKRLSTLMAKITELKKPTASFVFKLKSVKETNERGEWYGIEVTQGRKSTDAELQRAFEWYNKIKSSRVNVHDGDAGDEASADSGKEDDNIPF